MIHYYQYPTDRQNLLVLDIQVGVTYRNAPLLDKYFVHKYYNEKEGLEYSYVNFHIH